MRLPCRPLEAAELKHFEDFVSKKANDIIQKWIDYFVLHKKNQLRKNYKKD